MASIDESTADNESDDGYISMNTIKEIWYGNKMHLELNTRDARLKISDFIKQTKNERKGA